MNPVDSFFTRETVDEQRALWATVPMRRASDDRMPLAWWVVSIAAVACLAAAACLMMWDCLL